MYVHWGCYKMSIVAGHKCRNALIKKLKCLWWTNIGKLDFIFVLSFSYMLFISSGETLVLESKLKSEIADTHTFVEHHAQWNARWRRWKWPTSSRRHMPLTGSSIMFCIFVLYSLCGTACQEFICFLNRGEEKTIGPHIGQCSGLKNINVTQTFLCTSKLCPLGGNIYPPLSAHVLLIQLNERISTTLIWFDIIRFIWTSVCLLSLFQTFAVQLSQNFPFISSKYFVIVLFHQFDQYDIKVQLSFRDRHRSIPFDLVKAKYYNVSSFKKTTKKKPHQAGWQVHNGTMK